MNRSLRSQNLLVACLCISLVFAFKPVQAGVTEWMDIQVVDGHLLVATEVAGVQGFSILDTGATATAINGAFVEAENLSYGHGPKVTISGVHGKSQRNS